MAIRDVGHTVRDLTRAGIVVTKKLAARRLADERAVTPGMVSELVGRIHPERIRVEVAEVVVETPSTRTLRLVSGDGPFPPFRAGQFVCLFLEVGGVRTGRPYSVSSPPSRTGSLDITVRRMAPGFVSAHLCEKVAAGECLEISGPAGCFVREPLVDTNDLVFLAGGCGITPFMSMIQHAADTHADLRMHLIYGNRSPEDVIFQERLAALAVSMKNFRMDLVISEPPPGYDGCAGFLDAGTIRKLAGDPAGKTFFVCGPHAMVDLCLRALEELGVPGRRIKRELSGPLPDITVVKGWPREIEGDREFAVKVDGRGVEFRARASEPLLNSLERQGLTLDALCRAGDCGACRIRLLEGKVFMPETVSLRKTDAVFGYIHTCAAYPVSDLTIRV